MLQSREMTVLLLEDFVNNQLYISDGNEPE
jgi:hypothetical protein